MTGKLTTDQQAWIDAAHIEPDREGWRHVHIGGDPYPRGFQHGYLLAQDLDSCLRSNRFWAYWMTAQDFQFFIDKAIELYQPLIDDEFLQEMHGIAEGAVAAGVDTSFGEILAWNSFVDLIYTGWGTFKQQLHPTMSRPSGHRYVGHRCSAFVATGSATADGQIVMAHTTWDAFLQAQHFNVIMEIAPTDGHAMTMQTAPGWIASMMDFTVTGAGLMITETTIDGYTGFDETKPPEFYVSRKSCQYASSITEWCEMMKAQNNGGYANSWLLGDCNTGQIARYEVGLEYQSTIELLADGVLYGENIPTDLNIRNLETDDPDAWSDISRSGARRVRWKKLLRENYGRIDEDLAKTMIGDHYDEFLLEENPCSRTLCGHVDEDNGQVSSAHGHPPFYPWGAVDGKVASSSSAQAMGFDARWGRACGQPFDAAAYLEAHPQYDWLAGYLIDRPARTWATFANP